MACNWAHNCSKQSETTPSASRLKRAETDRVSSRRVRTESREPVGDKASPRSPEEQRDGSLSPLSSVHRARACSIKGHHYKNRSLASAGLWRDMPVFTPWGCLESLHQPSLSCATARVARTTSRSVLPQDMPTSPYAEREPRDAEMSPRTPRPGSARAHYQAAMSGTSPIVGEAWGTEPSEIRAGSRPGLPLSGLSASGGEGHGGPCMGSTWSCCHDPALSTSADEEYVHPSGPPMSFRPLAGGSVLRGAADAVTGVVRSVAESLIQQRTSGALEDASLSPMSRETQEKVID
eukprot:s1572_g17.t2